MTTPANRFVVGPDGQGRSAVLQSGLTNVQSQEGFFWRATLWATQETPVDNTIAGDRSQTPDLGESLQPFPNGLICTTPTPWTASPACAASSTSSPTPMRCSCSQATR